MYMEYWEACEIAADRMGARKYHWLYNTDDEGFKTLTRCKVARSVVFKGPPRHGYDGRVGIYKLDRFLEVFDLATNIMIDENERRRVNQDNPKFRPLKSPIDHER